MRYPDRALLTQLRGAIRLGFEATHGIAGIVETMHRTVQIKPGPLGSAVSDRPRGITGLVYRSVLGSIQAIGQAIDATLEPLAKLLPEDEEPAARDAWRSAVNGICGDHLHRTGNPLAIDMSLIFRGRRLDPENPADAVTPDGDAKHGDKILLLAHGLCLNEQHWEREGHDHGARLAGELGHTPIYLRYSSGLRIAANGRALAGMLETLIANWPSPVDELVIIGHSMGGLVARSACHYASRAKHAWPQRLRKLVFLGTPHHGAPLERGGHGLDLIMDLSPYAAPIARIGAKRSAGITDLRHGTITTGAHRPVPLPQGTDCYAVAADRARDPGALSERLIGDGLVPVDSALGRHRDATRALAMPTKHQMIAYQTGHFDLLNDAAVYAQLLRWLSHPRREH